MSKFVYVCSPYSGDVERNIKYACELSRELALEGYITYTPHLELTRFLNDNIPEEREAGMRIGQSILKKCDTLVVGCKYGISNGMRAEIKIAQKEWKEIVFKDDEFLKEQNIQKYI